jgi:hypothetical protein
MMTHHMKMTINFPNGERTAHVLVTVFGKPSDRPTFPYAELRSNAIGKTPM